MTHDVIRQSTGFRNGLINFGKWSIQMKTKLIKRLLKITEWIEKKLRSSAPEEWDETWGRQ